MAFNDPMDLTFCSQLATQAESGVAIGASGKRLPIASMSTANNLLTLRALHLKTKATKTLEIGLATGGSALVFTQTHKDLGHSATRQHVAIDPCQRMHWIDSAGLESVRRAGLSDYLRFIEAPSVTALPSLLTEEARFDLIYVDGSHLFEDVFLDLFYSAQLLEPGGIIAFDDCTDPHIAKVMQFARTNMRHCLREFNLAAFHPRGKSWRYQAARMLGKTQILAFQRTVAPFAREWDSAFTNF